MNNTRWWSQPFPPEGSQTASGIRRQLGQSGLNPTTVLVRESVQNSWDARLPKAEGGSGRIEVSFSLDRLGSRAVAWRDVLLDDRGHGPQLGSEMSLKKCLTSDDYILTISDRGTTGLGGPLRADEPVKDGQTPNFVQFIRNVGEPRDQENGGGTYGFGKGILYSFSKCSTILVRTRCPENDDFPRRLIGASLGDTFEDSAGKRHTGRHWWGAIAPDGIPDPVTGDEVEELTEKLGVADGRDATGTDVFIVAPNLDQEGINGDPRKLADMIVSAIVWNLWPKLGSSNRPRSIDFRVSVNGEQIEIPEIEMLPVLSSLSDALDRVHQMENERYSDPKMVERRSTAHPPIVGALALERTMSDFPSLRRLPPSVAAAVRDCPMERPFRHVARMRTAELVVDYLPGVPFKLAEIGYVGVYRASRQADEFFAESEPPTHDAWNAGGLSGTARGVVQGHKTFINRRVAEFVGGGDGTASKTVRGLGRLASTLGALISTSTGTAPAEQRTRSRSGGKKAVKKSRVVVPAHVEMTSDGPMIRAVVEVPEPRTSMRWVTANAEVIVAGGRKERDAPIGATEAVISGWRSEEGSDVRTGQTLSVQSGEAGRWIVEAPIVEDAAVRIFIEEEEL